MNILTITNEDEDEVVKLHIADVDPAIATVAILNALAAIPKPRKPRSDAGKPRVSTKAAGADGQE